MLLSTKHRFVFIATLKTASTAIETVLAPHAEVRLQHTRFGKHMSLRDVLRRFSFVFDEEPFEGFESFAVVRDPADRLHSLYRSHRDEWFLEHKPERYTGAMSFEEFLDDWLPRHPGQAISQHEQLTDMEGRNGVSRLVPFDHVPEVFGELVEAVLPNTQVDELPRRNESPDDDAPSHAEREIVKALYAEDVELVRRAAQDLRLAPRAVVAACPGGAQPRT